jgi:hypothetical protein
MSVIPTCALALLAAFGWYAWYREMRTNTRREAWEEVSSASPLSRTPAMRRVMEWRP